MTLLQTHAPAGTPSDPSVPQPQWWARVAAVCLALVTVAFLQDPGRVAADTKLDLTVDPAGFLGRALHLWDAEGFFGQLQNQSYGYLWPMGPFFLAGEALGLPDWVVQRLWWSLVLVCAFLGMYLLVRALGVGHGWPQILAGLAYAMAVRPQSALGAISVEVWPMAVAPWVLLPLVRVSQRGGLRAGSTVRAAALSALAVASAGGVNAVAAGAVLPLAVWWLLTRQPGPARRRLTLWWMAATTAAILWWFIPLVVLGRYSPPFLDWIESAEYTTSVTDPTSVLRGASHWLAYLGRFSAWDSGWMLATYPWLILATGVVTAAGVGGLAMRSLPHRWFLVGGAMLGFVLVSAGHTGVLSGLGSEQIQDFLDGAGAPLRNIHKFDLVLRIPLTVALCHLLSRIWPRGPRPRWQVVVSGLLLAALVASWWPTLSGHVARGRSFVAMADHWRDTSQWLNEVADPGRALIVPGASFGDYVWGRTQDEPLQALGGYPWGVRDAVPLSSAGNIRMLDAVEARLASGRGSAGLSEYLHRMGVRYLVVRNDLSAGAGAPLPILVHQAIDDSPGIRRVAFFGPIVDQTAGPAVVEEGLRESYPAVEIYEVAPSNPAPDPRVLLRPASGALGVEGSPEALLALADAQMLGNRATIVAGDPSAAGLAADAGIVTDTDRRREVTFGYIRDNESPTMTRDQPYQQRRSVHDYRVVGESGSTTAGQGLRFEASSSASDVDATWRKPRGATPQAAMDGALDTYWRPGEVDELESFWEVRYDQPVVVKDSLTLALLNRGGRTPTTLPLIVATANGSRQVSAQDDSGWQTVPVASGPTDFVRIEVGEPVTRTSQFGIREVRLPGEGVSRLHLPAGGRGDAVLLTARPGDAASCVHRREMAICTDGLDLFSQDRIGLFRAVDLPAGVTSEPLILVEARGSRGVERALQTVAGVRVTASSSRTRDVAGGPRAAFDRNVMTAWQAAPDDPDPSISLSLPNERTLRGIRLVNRLGLNASSPLEVRVDAGGKSFTGFTDTRGLFRFGPVTAQKVKVSFLSQNQVRTRSSFGEVLLPIGVSEIALIGADELRQPLPPDALMTLPCGSGPDVQVDGEVVTRTSVTARVEQFERGETLTAKACSVPVVLAAGQHEVDVRSSADWQPVLAAFAPESFYAPSGRPVSPRVQQWSDTKRTVDIEASDVPRVLEVAENFNPGWHATSGEQTLAPVRVDGWKQAFVVPTGLSGPVSLTFAPDSGYRAGLLMGLIGLLAVVWLAVRPPAEGDRPRTTTGNWPRARALLVALGVLLALGPWGLAAFTAAVLLARKPSPPVLAFASVLASVALAVVFGVRPSSAVQAAQGILVAIAWAGVVRGGGGAADGLVANGSAAEPGAPPARS